MSRREDCVRCTHAKETHAAEVESTGDLDGQERRIVYRGCLAAWCNCPLYMAPERRR